MVRCEWCTEDVARRVKVSHPDTGEDIMVCRPCASEISAVQYNRLANGILHGFGKQRGVKVTVYKDHDQRYPLTIKSETLGEAIRQLRTWIVEHRHVADPDDGYAPGESNGLTVWLTEDEDERDSIYAPSFTLECEGASGWAICNAYESWDHFASFDGAIDSFLQGVLASGEIDPKPTLQEIEKVLFEFGWPSFGYTADLPCM